MEPNNDKGVSFEGQEFQHVDNFSQPKESTNMAQWIVKHSGGKIETEKQANIILVVIAIIMIVISLFLF